jgi:hypothetical protein
MTDVTKRTPEEWLALAPALFETVLWAISELEELDDETAQVVVTTLRSTLIGSED